MRRFHPPEHYVALAKVRAADAAHTETMKRVCARGGITLQDMRKMNQNEKDIFIFRHRDRPENMKVAAE